MLSSLCSQSLPSPLPASSTKRLAHLDVSHAAASRRLRGPTRIASTRDMLIIPSKFSWKACDTAFVQAASPWPLQANWACLPTSIPFVR